MKNKKRVFIPVLVLVSFSLVAILITSLDLTPEKPDYTVFNNKDTGVALLYDTLKHMGYNVLPEYRYIKEDSDTSAARIVIMPDDDYFDAIDEKELLAFVKRGGRVIYLSARSPSDSARLYNILSSDGAVPVHQNGDCTLFAYGLGEIFAGPGDGVSNAALIEDKAIGYYTAEILDAWLERNVYFNEACHGYFFEPGFWNAVPAAIKNAVYQLVLVCALILLMLGKRFGKPIPYYEEIEREENEYLIALANLYNKSGHGYIIIESAMNRFFKKAALKLGIQIEFAGQEIQGSNILEEWDKRGLPYKDDLMELLCAPESDYRTKYPGGRRSIRRALSLIRKLENCL